MPVVFTSSYVFLKISSTNVDSLASFAVAAQRNGMKMYVNGYLKAQIKIYQKASIKYNTKMYMFNNVEKLQPAPVKCKLKPDRIKAEQQRLRMRRNGFIIIASEKPSFQQTIDEFADLPVKTIYSMWRGYITPGSKAFNQKLSEKRAEAVKAILVKKYKIAADRIATEGLGATDKLFDQVEFNRVALFNDTTK